MSWGRSLRLFVQVLFLLALFVQFLFVQVLLLLVERFFSQPLFSLCPSLFILCKVYNVCEVLIAHTVHDLEILFEEIAVRDDAFHFSERLLDISHR